MTQSQKEQVFDEMYRAIKYSIAYMQDYHSIACNEADSDYAKEVEASLDYLMASLQKAKEFMK